MFHCHCCQFHCHYCQWLHRTIWETRSYSESKFTQREIDKKGFRNPHDMWAYCDQHLFWNWLFNLYLCFHSLNWYCWFDGNEVFCSFLLICPLPLLAFLFVLLFVLEFWLLWLLWFWDFQNIVWVSVVIWLGIIRHRKMTDILAVSLFKWISWMNMVHDKPRTLYILLRVTIWLACARI